jgi:hypothetical protein
MLSQLPPTGVESGIVESGMTPCAHNHSTSSSVFERLVASEIVPHQKKSQQEVAAPAGRAAT